MVKVLIVGAGNIGQAITAILTESKQPYEVLVTDCHPNNFSLIRGAKTKHMVVESKDFREACENADYVVNAGPFFIATDVATICGEVGTHYLDLTEDVEQTSKVIELSGKYPDVAFIPQCGLAPGFISILANDSAKQFDKVIDVKMRVGALPMHPTNELKYNTTWSVDGLVNEYLHPCGAIKHGEIAEVDPLEGYETFNLDGDTYEAFNTSGGLGTLCETWHGKVQNMNYKTVRYVGHNYLMKFLINDLRLGVNNGDGLKQLIRDSIPTTNQDVVLIFVEVTGMIKNQFISRTKKLKIYGNGRWSAIQKTTATGLCVMLDLHRQGKIPQTGLIKQENATMKDFLDTDDSAFEGIYNAGVHKTIS
jgi:saccharopine dehydrogenase-like NADP-dependent oxidoreductase